MKVLFSIISGICFWLLAICFLLFTAIFWPLIAVILAHRDFREMKMAGTGKKKPFPTPEKPPVKPPVKPAAVTKFLPPWETGTAGPVMGEGQESPENAYKFDHVSAETKVLRRMFVAEYVKDHNGAAALARMGFDYNQPSIVAGRWLREPYTQYILDQYVKDAEQQALVTRNHIISALVREANSYGLDSSGASRVSALGKLAKILGMEITKVEGNLNVGGVMLVPSNLSPEDWEKQAAVAQSNLKAGKVA